MKFETLAVHAGRPIDPATSAVVPSITLSTTFERGEDGSFPNGHIYSRLSNPNRSALETALALLEGGETAFAFASGQAATAAVFDLLSTGDHAILPEDVFHGTRNLARQVMGRWGLALDLVDMTDLAAIENAIRPNTRLIWVETPSNPQLKITDIAAVAALAKRQGALCAVDNTWATPLLQRPLELGAELVMHSTTKYLGGHCDVLGGALIMREGVESELAQRLRTIQQLGGAVPSPFDCWLILRSLSTLAVRVRAQVESAGKIATFLHKHPRVAKTHYPGLATHPGHDIAARQMHSFGAMLSFEVAGGEAGAMAVASRVKIFTRATSLGAVESLIEHRASIEGVGTLTPPSLLRVSVGLEHVDDLIEDLAGALND